MSSPRRTYESQKDYRTPKRFSLYEGVGEDSDYKQLQKIRQSRVQAPFSIPKPSRLDRVSENLDYGDGCMLHSSPSLSMRDSENIQRKLFAAVAANDKDEVSRYLMQLHKHGGKPSEIRHKNTGQNILHFAISKSKKDIAKFLIERQGQDDLLLSYYEVSKYGVQGKCNALHLLIERNDTDTAKLFLMNIKSQELKLHLMHMETVLDIEGPRLASTLHMATNSCNVDLVTLFIDNGMDVNHRLNNKKDTALMWAARFGHDPIVLLLLRRGADPEIKNDKGSTPLYVAVRYGHASTVELLMKKGKADPNTMRLSGLVAPIIVASAYGNKEVLTILLRHRKIDVNMKIRGGESAIHHAAKEGHLEVLLLLLEHGADPNDKDELGDTPLLLAAKNNNLHVVTALIKCDVEFEHTNIEGHNVWYYAVENESNDLLQTLLIMGRNKNGNKSYSAGKQAILLAAKYGRCEKLRLLFQMEFDHIITDSDGNTFMHHAAMNNQHKVISAFPESDRVNWKNKSGNTPLHVACAKGFNKTIKVLMECNAQADIRNNKCEIALHLVASSKNIKSQIVKALVSYTGKTHSWESLNAKDINGDSCLHIAGRLARPDVIWEMRFVRFKDVGNDCLTPLHEAVRPNEPEVLDVMLDIFELMKRDARINDQSYSRKETVLHLAALTGNSKGVQRLIDLGADIAIKDHNGNTVLHKLIESCKSDTNNLSQYLEVFDTILDNVLKWWCIKHSITLSEENNDKQKQQRREATLTIVNDIFNNQGISVLQQAFKSGTPKILSRLLLMPGVTMLPGINENTYKLDLTGLTPMTDDGLSTGCCGTTRRRIAPLEEVDRKLSREEKKNNKNAVHLSGLQWLVSQRDQTFAEEIMDIPPINLLENYYKFIVGWTYAVLLILHIVYMGIFTRVAINLQNRLYSNNLEVGKYVTDIVLMYAFLPLEPLLIVMSFVYSLQFSEIASRFKLSKGKRSLRIWDVIVSYMFHIVCAIYAALVFLWIGLYSIRYDHQDSVVAFALCIGWMLSIALTRGIKIVHFFYKMLLKIVFIDIFRFLFVYSFVLLGFSFAFHVLLQTSEQLKFKFENPAQTIFLTFNMMVGMGELFDDDDTVDSSLLNEGRQPIYIKLMYIVYIVLSTIILLNLLIAMMNNSYSRILQQNEVIWRIDSISLGMYIESNFHFLRGLGGLQLTQGLGEDQLLNDCHRWFVDIDSKELERKMLEHDLKYKESKTNLQTRVEELELRSAMLEKQLVYNRIGSLTSEPEGEQLLRSDSLSDLDDLQVTRNGGRENEDEQVMRSDGVADRGDLKVKRSGSRKRKSELLRRSDNLSDRGDLKVQRSGSYEQDDNQLMRSYNISDRCDLRVKRNGSYEQDGEQLRRSDNLSDRGDLQVTQ